MPEIIRFRKLKEKLLDMFYNDDLEDVLVTLSSMPHRKVVNPLFSFFYSKDELIRWKAVTAMGAVVSRLAEEDMESARVVMRRLMWNLNDESGGIGWGSAEAMGEIMARNEHLATEYACILISYINPEGNFIENPALQRGVLWGLGRLAQGLPHLIEEISDYLAPFLSSQDPFLRGLAAWTASFLTNSATRPLLISLYNDNEKISFYFNGNLCERTIGSFVQPVANQEF